MNKKQNDGTLMLTECFIADVKRRCVIEADVEMYRCVNRPLHTCSTSNTPEVDFTI